MRPQGKVDSVVVLSTEVHHGRKLTETDSEGKNRQRRRGEQKETGEDRIEAYIQNRRKDRGGHTKQRQSERDSEDG